MPAALSPNVHCISLQQLGSYDDILTDTLVDGVSYFNTQKLDWNELGLTFIDML